jgi:NAD(P)-dependent dehydrogenase (short-subunit alcohol dehydrogenase family)
MDITCPDSVAAVLQQIESRFGYLDVLINNAGIAVRGAVEDLPDAAWNAVWAVNVLGPAHLIRAGLPLMRRAAHARIINISTVAALPAMPNMSAYTATKAALDVLSRSLHAELAPLGIFVTLARIGLTDTALFANAERYSREFLPNQSRPDPSVDLEATRFAHIRRKYAADPNRIARDIQRVVAMSSPPACCVIPASARFLQIMAPLFGMMNRRKR